MMTHTSDLELAAKECAGNWHEFQSFGWSRANDLDDSHNWVIVYTSNRDSGLLAQSNERAIQEIMEPFTEGDDPDCVGESHNHWACGYVDGYSIRVYDASGKITPAFEAWFGIVESLENYPVLNDEDYSSREYEATLENVKQAGESFAQSTWDGLELPDRWEGEAYSWFSNNDPGAIEDDGQDQGGYPSDAEIRECFTALGWMTEEKE